MKHIQYTVDSSSPESYTYRLVFFFKKNAKGDVYDCHVWIGFVLKCIDWAALLRLLTHSGNFLYYILENWIFKYIKVIYIYLPYIWLSRVESKFIGTYLDKLGIFTTTGGFHCGRSCIPINLMKKFSRYDIYIMLNSIQWMTLSLLSLFFFSCNPYAFFPIKTSNKLYGILQDLSFQYTLIYWVVNWSLLRYTCTYMNISLYGTSYDVEFYY